MGHNMLVHSWCTIKLNDMTTQQQKSVAIAKTIQQQLLGTGKIKVWSWGANSWAAINNGLQFKVQGFIFRGVVRITLHPSDTYTIQLIKNKKVQQEFNGVHFDEMVDLIDINVEYTGDNYEKDVDNAVYSI